MTDLRDLLRAQRGRYLWGVRTGDESLLSWQVGEPHLHVAMGRTREGLDQRHAAPRGRWQVAVLDGEARLATPLGELTLSADTPVPAEREPLAYLEGQALVRFELGPTIRLVFDLDTELVARGLLRCSGPEGHAEWTSRSG